MEQNKSVDKVIEAGIQLLDRDISDIYSFLGIQAEQLETAEFRLEEKLEIPEWSDEDAYAKVIYAPERAPLSELLEYEARGKGFLAKCLKKFEPELRGLLCKDCAMRQEIKDLESDTRALLKYITTSMLGLLALDLPAAIVGAASSIAVSLAVIIIKNKVETFCKSGVHAAEQ